ncbi:MAG: hypothetical protein WCQ47_01470, partial [bacterium]
MFLRKLGLFFLILILTLSSSCTLSMRTHGTTTTGKQSIGVSSAKDITAFLIDESIGVINGTNITVTLPFGTTDLKALVPTITTTGTNVSPASGIAEDFTNPRTYRVTAADGSTKDYRVTVTVSASSDKDILVFTLPNQIGSTVIANTSSTTGAIAVTVPYGTSVANLVASFSTTGISVAIGSTPQVSGVTANNFTSTKAYTVT